MSVEHGRKRWQGAYPAAMGLETQYRAVNDDVARLEQQMREIDNAAMEIAGVQPPGAAARIEPEPARIEGPVAAPEPVRIEEPVRHVRGEVVESDAVALTGNARTMACWATG